MKVSGSTTSRVASEKRHGLMARFFEASSETGKNTEKDSSYGLMETHTMETLKITNFMEMVFTSGPMGGYITANGNITNSTATALSSGPTAKNTLGSTKRALSTDREQSKM